ncbi:MAG: helix-turn-helix transcriptional regulator [bacterium]|nr:helix-turn-helix transcriptional regulator [bacterium]
MKFDVDKEMKIWFSCVERWPELKKSGVGQMVFRMIESCDLEDLKYLDIAWMARKMNISCSYLVRCYKSFFLHTPGRQLQRKKIIFATDLLVDCPHLSIKQVAEMLDYCSADYFIKIFKNRMGVTPLRYRISMRMEGFGWYVRIMTKYLKSRWG